ncbi:MAG: hypothetical protein RI841_04205 [Halomonas sp.]|uniref:hypothetical protein n=1 Tax=Halomonas sp. TaxID=1486246 RepID=UPI0028705B56|nr:hypothetical protein [Halomonas sp.]MDR9438689.1 hypothetical protein [Halomonas sp.]
MTGALALAFHNDYASGFANLRQVTSYTYAESPLTPADGSPFEAGPIPGAPLMPKGRCETASSHGSWPSSWGADEDRTWAIGMLVAAANQDLEGAEREEPPRAVSAASTATVAGDVNFSTAIS